MKLITSSKLELFKSLSICFYRNRICTCVENSIGGAKPSRLIRPIESKNGNIIL